MSQPRSTSYVLRRKDLRLTLTSRIYIKEAHKVAAVKELKKALEELTSQGWKKSSKYETKIPTTPQPLRENTIIT